MSIGEQSASRWNPNLSCLSVINSPKYGAVADPVTLFPKAFINLTLVFIATHQGAVTNTQLYLTENGGFICSKGYSKHQRPTVVWILGNCSSCLMEKTWSTKVGPLQFKNRVCVTLSCWALLLWSIQTPTLSGAGRQGTFNTLDVIVPEGTLPCHLQTHSK